MAYEYVKDHTKVNRTKGNSGRKYIVIHYTGNSTDTAKANANYFRTTNRGASAHLFVDKTSIYEVVSLDDSAWAVGRNYGSNNLFGKCTNSNSISIEMCSDNSKIAEATYKNTVKITKKLMKKYDIPAKRVVRHYDVCSKACPGWKGWIGSDESIWNQFKKDIKEDTFDKEAETADFEEYKAIVTASSLNIREKANTDSKILGSYSKDKVITIVKENKKGTWGKTNKGWISLDYVKRKK